ncbi:ABC transporter ATP-binding protein [Thermocladium modestius]|uniref:ABC transporter ATP-binding protein n=1 Tax=Thermocladium modestius TaxID=62609 RepID=A0A830GYP7_9CREN|nr:ABC transporter ATP-binding protein [Thermocladium modestius]GGP22432.1 ABC transporter ATP-binding protein [Thermocladium modestius]
MHAIEARNLWFRYEGEWVIRGVSWVVEPSRAVGLIGRSGSGKTTLLRILAGARRPSRGSVFIMGMDPRKARGILAYVPQNPSHSFYMPTALEEVMDSLIGIKGLSKRDAATAAMNILNAFGLGEYAGENPFNLSWGEQRRLSLAVVAAYGPRVILLDEPSTGLSYRDKEWVAALLNGLDSTMVIATHDVDFLLLMGVDEAVELENGVLEPLSCGRLVSRSEVYMVLRTAELPEPVRCSSAVPWGDPLRRP